MTREAKVNTNFIVEALGRFMKIFKQKRPVMQKWFSTRAKALVETQLWGGGLTAKGIQMIGHLLYSLDLSPTGFFLFPMVNKELAGLSLAQETFKNSWEGEMRTTAKEDFAAAFRQWYELCKIVCTSPTTMSKKVKK